MLTIKYQQRFFSRSHTDSNFYLAGRANNVIPLGLCKNCDLQEAFLYEAWNIAFEGTDVENRNSIQHSSNSERIFAETVRNENYSLKFTNNLVLSS